MCLIINLKDDGSLGEEEDLGKELIIIENIVMGHSEKNTQKQNQ